MTEEMAFFHSFLPFSMSASACTVTDRPPSAAPPRRSVLCVSPASATQGTVHAACLPAPFDTFVGAAAKLHA